MKVATVVEAAAPALSTPVLAGGAKA
jgi:hypothetical protein